MLYLLLHLTDIIFDCTTWSNSARYKRTLPTEDDKESPIGRSFYNAYQVTNKIDLEKKLNDIAGLEYEWNPEGSLTVTTEPIPGKLALGRIYITPC